jgi:hypothetical protein
MPLTINVFLPRLHVLMYFVVESCKETDSVDMIYGRIQDVSVTEIPTLLLATLRCYSQEGFPDCRSRD